MFDDINFEIDEEGTPYWVASVINKTIGLFSGTDCKGAVLMNAVTGESQYYELSEIPTWVDRVFSADLIVEQYNYYGRYLNGFWNSLFGQSNCTETTSGYNYIALNDDVWMYTGVTSVTGDRGNIGFILVNQRTKEANYYSCAGAEETSAMSSAEGAVQQFSYNATFPLLLNVSGQPTYFMALKDDAGLVKQYAMVNVQQYQIVATGNSLAACQANYKELMLAGGFIEEEDVGELPEDETKSSKTESIEGKVLDIRTAEMTKVVENTFRAVNIAFANELAKICRHDNMDVYEIIKICNMHPRVNILQPGPGVGGHCISVDPWFLVGDYPSLAKVIDESMKTNDGMPDFVLNRIYQIMKENGLTDMSRVGLYGLTYKENVDDMRESPTLQLLASQRHHLAAPLKSYDPFITKDVVPNQMHDLDEFIDSCDLVVIMVKHNEIKENVDKLKGKVILDCHNIIDLPGVYHI